MRAELPPGRPAPASPDRPPIRVGSDLARTESGQSPQATAQAFESVFLGQMMQLMLESAGEADGFDGGNGEAMFRGVLAEELGRAVASAGGIGLAPAVMAQIIRLQEGQ